MKNKKLVIGILIIIILLIFFGIIISLELFGKLNILNGSKEDTIKINDIRGKYVYTKTYNNDSGNQLNLNVKITLDMDNTATYEISDGYDFEKTKGVYSVIENRIVYTKQYYNDGGINGQDSVYADENSKTEIFSIVDKNNLKKESNFHDKEVILERTQ